MDFTSASASIFFPYGGVGYGSATGGTSSSITDGGLSYTLLTFNSDANLVVGTAGLFDVLVIGGGGSGGGGGFGCGGGGAGNYIRATVYLAAATYAVTIGTGGAGNGGAGNSGGISKLAVDPKLWAYGGLPGKEQNYGALDGDGGISGTPDSYVGGHGVVASNGEAGGGGGGSTGAGTNGVASSVGGTGGAGYTSTFSGSSVARAGGGGGGGAANTTGGPGTAGGGNGAQSGAGANATANTGGGGGGGGSGGNGGNGAAGVVLVRFRV